MIHCVEEVLNEVLNVLRLHFYYNIEAGWDLTHPPPPPPLMPHICVNKLCQPLRRQAIIWSNGLLSIGHLSTVFNEILIKIHNFSSMNMHLKTSFATRRPFCPGGDELSTWRIICFPHKCHRRVAVSTILCVEWNHQFPSFGPRNRLPIFWSVGWGVLSFTERPVS